jgi:hypothetical protein
MNKDNLLRGGCWKGTFPSTLNTPLLSKWLGLNTSDNNPFSEFLQSHSYIRQSPVNAIRILPSTPQYLTCH